MVDGQSNRDEQQQQEWQHSKRSLPQAELDSNCKMNVCLQLAGAVLKPVVFLGGGGGWKRLVKMIALLDDSTSSKSRDHSLSN